MFTSMSFPLTDGLPFLRVSAAVDRGTHGVRRFASVDIKPLASASGAYVRATAFWGGKPKTVGGSGVVKPGRPGHNLGALTHG
jgi:hypothetical protein